ncbi:MAG: hypothetical protein ACREAU_03140 [Nitrosopumilaceae archaeon]
MARIRSAKGLMVDFDILQIKQQMEKASPPTATVKARENFIEKKLRRRVDTIKRQPAVEAMENEGGVSVVSVIPGNDESPATFIPDDTLVDLVEPKIKQKARK